MRPLRLPAIAILLLLASPARAQSARTPLDVRMRRFLGTVAHDGDRRELAAFFPRSGEWRRVLTVHRSGSTDSVEVRRFAAGEIPALSRPGGPLCTTFQPALPGALSAAMGSLADAVDAFPRGWTRVRGNRFVPPTWGVRSPVFVEWTRENGRWVIAALGEEADEAPGEPGVDTRPLAIRRDPSPGAPLRLPLADARYAAGAEWYETRETVFLDGFLYWRYSVPRPLHEGDVVRIGSLQGVGVYVEPGQFRYPEIIYVAVDRDGTFQPYQVLHPAPCAWGAPGPE